MTIRRDNGFFKKQTAHSVAVLIPPLSHHLRHYRHRAFYPTIAKRIPIAHFANYTSSKARMATWSAKLGIRFAPKKGGQLGLARLVESENTDAISTATIPRATSTATASTPSPSDQITNVASPQQGRPSSPTPLEGEDEEPGLEAQANASLSEVIPNETSISYKINPELFHKARKQPQGTTGSWYSYMLYRRTLDDGSERKVRVHYCRRQSEMELVLKKHFLGASVIGFDMEWNSYATAQDGAKMNCSLIQMATPSRIGLFHVARFESSHKRFVKEDPLDTSLSGPVFRQIMEDTEVMKVGVNILGDCTRLKTHLGIQSGGIFELSHQARILEKVRGESISLSRRPIPLAWLVSKYLQLPMYKGSVRTSSWQSPLNESQIRYAATDAYAGVQLYHVLEAQRLKLKPSPLAPALAELKLPVTVQYPISESEEDGTSEDCDIDSGDDAVSLTRSQSVWTAATGRSEPSQGTRSKLEDSVSATLPSRSSTKIDRATTRDKALGAEWSETGLGPYQDVLAAPESGSR